MARSRSSRASSTPRLEAASISTTSSEVRPAQIVRAGVALAARLAVLRPVRRS